MPFALVGLGRAPAGAEHLVKQVVRLALAPARALRWLGGRHLVAAGPGLARASVGFRAPCAASPRPGGLARRNGRGDPRHGRGHRGRDARGLSSRRGGLCRLLGNLWRLGRGRHLCWLRGRCRRTRSELARLLALLQVPDLRHRRPPGPRTAAAAMPMRTPVFFVLRRAGRVGIGRGEGRRALDRGDRRPRLGTDGSAVHGRRGNLTGGRRHLEQPARGSATALAQAVGRRAC